jgi:dCMP deaminase
MQLAATARNMSGCLSRQVGAVLVNPSGYVVGIGSNNPPEGQVPCSVRSCSELLDADSEDTTYSEFERSERFREHIKSKNAENRPFCFRSEYARLNSDKGSEFTRALHAEENAILQTAKFGGMSVQDATLYTTASTCTLCAKKAYHLDVKRIVFIEEYPGIAHDQTIATGKKNILFDQFEGITGSAYFSLFNPLMPEKDLFDLY